MIKLILKVKYNKIISEDIITEIIGKKCVRLRHTRIAKSQIKEAQRGVCLFNDLSRVSIFRCQDLNATCSVW